MTERQKSGQLTGICPLVCDTTMRIAERIKAEKERMTECERHNERHRKRMREREKIAQQHTNVPNKGQLECNHRYTRTDTHTHTGGLAQICANRSAYAIKYKWMTIWPLSQSNLVCKHASLVVVCAFEQIEKWLRFKPGKILFIANRDRNRWCRCAVGIAKRQTAHLKWTQPWIFSRVSTVRPRSNQR